MTTTIKITPPGGVQQVIPVYETCETRLSATDRAGSFNLTIPAYDSTLVDVFPVGSDVQITQDDNEFRGWVVRPPKSLNGRVRLLEFEGATYTSRTQKIIVTESYTDTAISTIVADLFTKYATWATQANIETCAREITVSFADVYLWDAMEQLCTIAGYDWYIDESLDVNFFGNTARINTTILSQANSNYKKGTAHLTPDATKLVNKLWVKGGKAASDPYTQAITVSADPIALFYTPKATAGTDVTVIIDGNTKTVGIQSVDGEGTKDFLLNPKEKLLIPDNCTTGTGTIIYNYEYPIKLLLEDLESQAVYGVFEDIYKVEADDKTLVKDLGLQYLAKYSTPVISGSIEPINGVYKPGELIKVEIPDLLIDEYLQIIEVGYSSVRGSTVINRTLSLQSRERDAASILKDLNSRLARLEKSIYNDDEGPVEKYVAFADSVTIPAFVDDGLTWSLHQYNICGQVVVKEALQNLEWEQGTIVFGSEYPTTKYIRTAEFIKTTPSTKYTLNYCPGYVVAVHTYTEEGARVGNTPLSAERPCVFTTEATATKIKIVFAFETTGALPDIQPEEILNIGPMGDGLEVIL